MSKEPEKPMERGDGGIVAGARLAAARRAREISLAEIARELHLDESKVLALEGNDFDRLGGAVFVQGYLRKYAVLVDVPAEDVLQEYQRLSPAKAPPPVVGTRRPPQEERARGGWLGGGAVLAAVLLVGWWWTTGGADIVTERLRPAAPETSAPEVSEAAGAVQGSAEGEVEESAEEPGAVEGAVESGDVVEEAATALTEPGLAAEAPAEGQVRLVLVFSGDCWTEVTDATGESLHYGLVTAGRMLTLAGEPPLRVLLGDSSNVAVEVDGSPFAIPAASRRGATASFTVSP